MRGTKIEVRTAALRAGRMNAEGHWVPGGQLVATLWLEEPGETLARELAAGITRIGDEAVVAEVVGREEIPAE